MPDLPTNPQVLSEAQPDSLQELFSRDPEGYQRQDRDKIVSELRAMRKRFQQTELLGKKPSAKRASAKNLTTTSDLEDLGLWQTQKKELSN